MEKQPTWYFVIYGTQTGYGLDFRTSPAWGSDTYAYKTKAGATKRVGKFQALGETAEVYAVQAESEYAAEKLAFAEVGRRNAQPEDSATVEAQPEQTQPSGDSAMYESLTVSDFMTDLSFSAWQFAEHHTDERQTVFEFDYDQFLQAKWHVNGRVTWSVNGRRVSKAAAEQLITPAVQTINTARRYNYHFLNLDYKAMEIDGPAWCASFSWDHATDNAEQSCSENGRTMPANKWKDYFFCRMALGSIDLTEQFRLAMVQKYFWYLENDLQPNELVCNDYQTRANLNNGDTEPRPFNIDEACVIGFVKNESESTYLAYATDAEGYTIFNYQAENMVQLTSWVSGRPEKGNVPADICAAVFDAYLRHGCPSDFHFVTNLNHMLGQWTLAEYRNNPGHCVTAGRLAWVGQYPGDPAAPGADLAGLAAITAADCWI